VSLESCTTVLTSHSLHRLLYSNKRLCSNNDETIRCPNGWCSILFCPADFRDVVVLRQLVEIFVEFLQQKTRFAVDSQRTTKLSEVLLLPFIYLFNMQIVHKVHVHSVKKTLKTIFP